jgi:hypothetical protein
MALVSLAELLLPPRVPPNDAPVGCGGHKYIFVWFEGQVSHAYRRSRAQDFPTEQKTSYGKFSRNQRNEKRHGWAALIGLSVSLSVSTNSDCSDITLKRPKAFARTPVLSQHVYKLRT